MYLAYRFLFPLMWLAWVLVWWIASRGVRIQERRESLGSRLTHVLPLLFAAVILFLDRIPGVLLNQRLFPRAAWVFWVAALVTAVGLGFAIWARVQLGRNWSGSVAIKQDHELITTGPYSLVRHPIYTGLLLALAGSALARGEWRGVVAVAIAGAALWRKLRLEERWMLELFGNEYAEYCRRVPALFPSRMTIRPSEIYRFGAVDFPLRANHWRGSARIRNQNKVITHRGGCHCGRVRFEVVAPAKLQVSECNCSICSKAGYLHLIVPADRFKLLSGTEVLTSYSFNTRTAKHLFCAVCGIKSFHVPRSHPDGFSVNARCLDPSTIEAMSVTQVNGREWEKQYPKGRGAYDQ